MKKEWLKILRDPFDKTKLRFNKVKTDKGGNVVSGQIKSSSGHIYKIRHGVPCFLSKESQKVDSVKSFEFEWNTFGFLYAKEGWLQDIVKPLVGGEKFFKNKIVVDAGAGSGSQSRWMAEAGAKLVISLELSESIYGEFQKTTKNLQDTIFPIQCDIAKTPVSIFPDVVYCINVIQHTKNIEKTFSNLCSMVGPNTKFLFNVYTEKPSAPVVRLTRKITIKMPFLLVYWLSFVISIPFYFLIKIQALLKGSGDVIPKIRSLKETWLDIYDLLGPHHYQEYMTKDTQLNMIHRHNLKVVRDTKFGYLLEKRKNKNGQ